MTSSTRRESILDILSASDQPISASVLANRFSVSRQVIVSDIALLRAGGCAIISTPRGYYTQHDQSASITHQLICCHTSEEMADELNTIVDCGCTVINVTVEHPIYGVLTGELLISSRLDVECFVQRVKSADALPLSALTEGLHTHTISCPSEDAFSRLCDLLRQQNYLISAK